MTRKGRKVREMLPMKIESPDETGGGVSDVVWDHIHKMSLDHALSSFDQRDINKQKRSASRDLQSCLDNNPNVAKHKSQFQFDFMTEELEEQIVEKIDESEKPKPR